MCTIQRVHKKQGLPWDCTPKSRADSASGHLSIENRIGMRPWSRTSIVVSHGDVVLNRKVTFSLIRAVSLSAKENLVLDGEKVK